MGSRFSLTKVDGSSLTSIPRTAEKVIVNNTSNQQVTLFGLICERLRQ